MLRPALSGPEGEPADEQPHQAGAEDVDRHRPERKSGTEPSQRGEVDAVPQHAADAGAKEDEKRGGHHHAIASAAGRHKRNHLGMPGPPPRLTSAPAPPQKLPERVNDNDSDRAIPRHRHGWRDAAAARVPAARRALPRPGFDCRRRSGAPARPPAARGQLRPRLHHRIARDTADFRRRCSPG